MNPKLFHGYLHIDSIGSYTNVADPSSLLMSMFFHVLIFFSSQLFHVLLQKYKGEKSNYILLLRFHFFS